MNIVSDVALIAFMVPRFLPLHLPRGQKISLIAIVALGFLVIIAAIVRLIRVVQNGNNPYTTCKVTAFIQPPNQCFASLDC